MPKRGYIQNGRYYSNDGRPSELIETPNSTYSEHNRDMQRTMHQHDLIQPFTHGKPNPEFMREYPDESEAYFGIDTKPKEL